MRGERGPRAADHTSRPKYYLDESVGIWVADVLGSRHQNVETAEQASLLGRADSDHFAHCWRHERVLITHDFDFYDYKNPEVPDVRNPGVIVLDCDSGDAAAIEAIIAYLPLITDLIGERGWRHTRTIVSPVGRVTIRRRNRNSGADEIERYRRGRQGPFVRERSANTRRGRR
jgi:hypothetical protein